LETAKEKKVGTCFLNKKGGKTNIKKRLGWWDLFSREKIATEDGDGVI